MTMLTLPLTELELVLIEDLVDYAADHFEAPDAATAERFQSHLETLRAKLLHQREAAGLTRCAVDITADWPDMSDIVH